MKKIVLIAIMCIFLFGLCSWSSNASVKYPESIGSFYGLCASVRNDFLAVYPFEKPQVFNQSTNIMWLKIYTDDHTEFYTPDGLRINKEDLKAGMQAEFFYDAESDVFVNEHKIGSLSCFKICMTGKFTMTGPAKLTVKNGVSTCTAPLGTAHWWHSTKKDDGVSYSSDAISHPVDRDLNTLPNDGSNSFELCFDIEPQELSVSAWSGSLISAEERDDYADIDAGELKIKAEGYTVNLPPNPDGWVIQVNAKWKHENAEDEILWYGGGEYTFFFTG